MARSTINILIIEDSNLIADAYKNILNQTPNRKYNLSFAKDCDEAIIQIERKHNNIILLDLQLPVSKDKLSVSGEDLGLLIRKTSADTKIIIITSVTNQVRVLNIINEIDPEGFMVKSDIDPQEFKSGVEDIIKGKKYYSETIDKHYKKIIINGIPIDDYDRQILYHLSMGEKTKDLKKFVPLSTRAIEERKVKLKALMGHKKDTNFNLVKAAKKLGYV